MIQLNQRQLDVLRWIGDGCPDRDWPGHSHKLTARSLAGKGLADVRRKKKIWTATITAAGQYYLEHGKPPPSQESDLELTAQPARRRQPSVAPDLPRLDATARAMRRVAARLGVPFAASRFRGDHVGSGCAGVMACHLAGLVRPT